MQHPGVDVVPLPLEGNRAVNPLNVPPGELRQVLDLKDATVPRELYLGPIWTAVVLSAWRSATYANVALNLTVANPDQFILPADPGLMRRVLAIDYTNTGGTAEDIVLGIRRGGALRVISIRNLAAAPAVGSALGHVDIVGAYPLVVPPQAALEVLGFGAAITTGPVNVTALVVEFPAGAEAPQM